MIKKMSAELKVRVSDLPANIAFIISQLWLIASVVDNNIWAFLMGIFWMLIYLFVIWGK